MLKFEPGEKYSRPEIKKRAGLDRKSQGGNWDTGVVEHEDEFVIFTNVGAQGRTGHNYGNRWEGELLHWYHKGGSRLEWPSVIRLLSGEHNVHLFWRADNSEPFEYAGYATAVQILDESPVKVIWSFVKKPISEIDYFKSPDELPVTQYTEGAVRQISVNVYERDRMARQVCIAHYGPSCAVCDMSFEERYGEIGAGYIHVHHLVPVSQIGENYKVNPIEDLRPVCPNCHAMIHRSSPPLSIDDIRVQLRK